MGLATCREKRPGDQAAAIGCRNDPHAESRARPIVALNSSSRRLNGRAVRRHRRGGTDLVHPGRRPLRGRHGSVRERTPLRPGAHWRASIGRPERRGIHSCAAAVRTVRCPVL